MHKDSTKRLTMGKPRPYRTTVSFMTSCKAIGWVSMLFAMSAVSAFSSTRRRADVVRTFVRAKSEHPGSFDRSKIVRARRDSTGTYVPLNGVRSSTGDSDRIFGRAAMVRPPRSAAMRRFAATQLNYRDGDEEDSNVRQEEHAAVAKDLKETTEATKWWQSVLQPGSSPTKEDEEQQVVDEYLEFLDKRYKRLHPKETQSPNRKFSALNWLKQDKPPEPITAQQEEDALYVLGVAELASQRLLQKHQVALQQQQQQRQAHNQERSTTPQERPVAMKKEPPAVIDAVVEEAAPKAAVAKQEITKTRLALMASILVQAGRNIFKGVGMRRRALIAYQDKALGSAAAHTVKSLARTPARAVKMFWNVGGGKRTIALTVSVFVTAFLLVRPLAEAMLQEATLA